MTNRGKSALENLIEIVCVFGLIGGIIAGIQLNYLYFSIPIISGGLLLALYFLRKHRFVKYRKIQINEEWGKDHKFEGDMKDIARLYILLEGKEKSSFNIDDISWKDLNMDSVFKKMNHTKSYTGMQYLYYLLRLPLFKKEELDKRYKLITQLKERKDIGQKIQYPLTILGRKQAKEIIRFFEEDMDIGKSPLLLYRFLSYIAYGSIILIFINRQIGFAALAAIITANAMIYQKIKNKIEIEIEFFRYIGNLVKCAESISKIDTEELEVKSQELKTLLKKTKAIYKNVSTLSNNDGGSVELQVLLDYINMITLREAIIFYKTSNLINKYKEELFKIYSIVGELDAYIGLASYLDSLDYYCKPELRKEERGFFMETKDLYHPLLRDPVAYNFKFDNVGALVTGSNASGKSTFLRTIGVNALLSQTINISLARQYTSNYFRLLTSIGTTDSIEEGDSYFMSEAKSLKRIIDILDKDSPVLCILDEIFRGTNTAERISAASEVLDYMSSRNTLLVAATHDLELTSLVDDKFNNYHFKETIETNDIKFDFILRKGPTSSRNAIEILRYLDYPKEIYENANSRVEDYIKLEGV